MLDDSPPIAPALAVDSDPNAWRPQRQKDFWRWMAGIGWALDFLLVAWAIFLRDIGIVEESKVERNGQGSEPNDVKALKLDGSTYASLLERDLQQEMSITETDNQLGSLLTDVSKELMQVSSQVERLMEPGDVKVPLYEDVALCRLIDELQARIEGDRELLQRRDELLLAELREKPAVLRSLSARLQQQRELDVQNNKVLTGLGLYPPPAPQEGGGELQQFLGGSALPVAIFLGISLLVTVLSQQFLRVATAWRRERWSKAERMRAIQGRRLKRLQDAAGSVLDDLAKGRLEQASKAFRGLAGDVGRWAAEPTWEEVVRTEAAELWERWGPEAFRMEAVLPNLQGLPKATGPQAKWVAERWFASAQAVVKDYVESALAAWAQAGKSPAASSEAAEPQASGLVIRIFGRWPQPAKWVNIANLPLAGDWREKALRLLIPAEKDVQDVPILASLCEATLTAVVSSQVSRVVSTSAWGQLTTDLWRQGGRAGSKRRFQIGYEVVEVPTQVPADMCAMARALPQSGTPGRVVRVRPGIESQIEQMEP